MCLPNLWWGGPEAGTWGSLGRLRAELCRWNPATKLQVLGFAILRNSELPSWVRRFYRGRAQCNQMLMVWWASCNSGKAWRTGFNICSRFRDMRHATAKKFSNRSWTPRCWSSAVAKHWQRRFCMLEEHCERMIWLLRRWKQLAVFVTWHELVGAVGVFGDASMVMPHSSVKAQV